MNRWHYERLGNGELYLSRHSGYAISVWHIYAEGWFWRVYGVARGQAHSKQEAKIKAVAVARAAKKGGE